MALANSRVFNQVGGVSKREYSQLNLAEKGDNPSNIRKNRALFLQEFGLVNPQIFMGEQVHGTDLEVVKNNSPSILQGIDGLLTDIPQNVLMAFFADCVPLFFVVPDEKIVAIAHAGWKGTANNIAGKTISYFVDCFQINPEKISVGLGPAIGPCCYEVGEDVADQFSRDKKYHHSGLDRFFIDLPGVNVSQLEDAGVPAANIGKSGFCTSCNPHLFYSYRRDRGKTGRMAGLIAII